ncbi:MAG: hypothetical protein AAGH79_03040 [Bacteroidota bacterium]
MKTYSLLFSICLMVGLMSCQKEEPAFGSDAYLIFGHFFGECFGEQCVETYKLTSEALFEDSEDLYPSRINAPIVGNFTELDQTLFDAIIGLEETLPEDLFNQNEVVYGTPDAGDWGGYYLAYSDEATGQWWWIIDTQKDNIPEHLHNLVDEIQLAIETINQ